MVELRGFEPLLLCVQSKCVSNYAIAPQMAVVAIRQSYPLMQQRSEELQVFIDKLPTNSLVGVAGLEPARPYDQQIFLLLHITMATKSVVVWTISSPYLTTQVRAVQSLHIPDFSVSSTVVLLLGVSPNLTRFTQEVSYLGAQLKLKLKGKYTLKNQLLCQVCCVYRFRHTPIASLSFHSSLSRFCRLGTADGTINAKCRTERVKGKEKSLSFNINIISKLSIYFKFLILII